MTSEARQEEIRKIRIEYAWVYPLALGFALLSIGIWIGASVFKATDGYGMNLFTEFVGIGATVFVIDQLRAYRDRESLKRRLIREAGSRSNDIAISAVEWLRREECLVGEKGLLKGVNLSNANLRAANLRDANLQNSTMLGTDLQDAELYYANLQRAMLLQANLQRAKFFKADLKGAVLINADLTGAGLVGADITGTIFVGATMPDGQEYFEGMNLSKYRELDEDTLSQINEIRISEGLNPISSVDDITDSLPMPKPIRLR